MAAASGLALVPIALRDPRVTTTRGTGELMRDALERDVERLIVCIGGSATTDGGCGMAQALGYCLLDAEGNELEPGGAAVARLEAIEPAAKHPRLHACEVLVACDVNNPLCGPNGAAHVYGPQKGADAAAVEELDAALRHFAAVARQTFGVDVLDMPGAGAAGGLGAGLVLFANAELRPGAELVAEACRLEERMRGADLVITGEGAVDKQTLSGKTPAGVAAVAKRLGIPLIALGGSLGQGYEALYEAGVSAAFSIIDAPMTLAQAMNDTRRLLASAAEAGVRLWLEGRHARK
jgi:glycerate kinase